MCYYLTPDTGINKDGMDGMETLMEIKKYLSICCLLYHSLERHSVLLINSSLFLTIYF